LAEVWDKKPLSDVADVNPEAVDRRNAPTEIRYIDIASVSSGAIDESAVRTLTWADAPSRAQRIVRNGDIIVSTVRPYLRAIARVTPSLDGAVASTGFAVVRARTREIDADLLWHVATSDQFFDHLEQRQTGTTYPAVRPGDVADAMIPVPPRELHEELASLLSASERAARAAAVVSASLHQLGLARRAAYFGALRMTDRLANHVEVRMGRQRSPKHQQGDFIVPYLRAANVKDGRLELGDVLAMNFSPEEQEKYALLAEDVLVTEGCGSRGQIGASARWSEEVDGPVCFQNTLLRLRAISGRSYASFVYHWARFAFESGAFADVASGTSIFHIGAERAVEMQFPVVELDEQIAIGGVLDACETAERAAAREAAAAWELNRAVVADTLYGTGDAMDGATAEALGAAA